MVSLAEVRQSECWVAGLPFPQKIVSLNLLNLISVECFKQQLTKPIRLQQLNKEG